MQVSGYDKIGEDKEEKGTFCFMLRKRGMSLLYFEKQNVPFSLFSLLRYGARKFEYGQDERAD